MDYYFLSTAMSMLNVDVFLDFFFTPGKKKSKRVTKDLLFLISFFSLIHANLSVCYSVIDLPKIEINLKKEVQKEIS